MSTVGWKLHWWYLRSKITSKCKVPNYNHGIFNDVINLIFFLYFFLVGRKKKKKKTKEIFNLSHKEWWAQGQGPAPWFSIAGGTNPFPLARSARFDVYRVQKRNHRFSSENGNISLAQWYSCHFNNFIIFNWNFQGIF